jgi:hypothetical protein
MVEIEFDDPLVTICECCGQPSRQLVRSIFDGDEIKAMYMTSLPSHPGQPVSVLMIWGDFAEEAPQSSRFAATFSIFPMKDALGTAVTDPEASGWERSDMATFLSKDEALERFSPEIFALSDMIVTQDKLVVDYLTQPVTMH